MSKAQLSHGIEIYYEEFGERDAPNGSVVLVMGLGAHMLAWPLEICETLRDRGYHVVRFDNRDVGLSTQFSDKGVPFIPWEFVKRNVFGSNLETVYSLEDMSDDVKYLMDYLNIQKAHLCGASMGGMIVQEFAIKYPDRTLSICSIMSTTGDASLPSPSWWIRLKLLKPAPEDEEGRAAYFVEYFKMIGSSKYYDEQQVSRVDQLVRDCYKRNKDRSGVARQLHAILNANSRAEKLKNVSCPALVIHGKLDPLLPLAHGIATHKALPEGAELVVLDDMGHDICLHFVPTYVDLFDRHFAKTRQQPSTDSTSLE